MSMLQSKDAALQPRSEFVEARTRVENALRWADKRWADEQRGGSFGRAPHYMELYATFAEKDDYHGLAEKLQEHFAKLPAPTEPAFL